MPGTGCSGRNDVARLTAFVTGLRACAVFLGASVPVCAQISQPAELPPPDYAGQQYVDTRGCLFMRAGTPGNELWIPRVTRQGVPMCGNPPSGRRVPVVEEGAAALVPESAPAAAPAVVAEPARPATAVVSGYFVAVGSFGVQGNVSRAIERLRALNYPVAQGQVSAGSALVTVYAGPFASVDEAARARAELVGLGFPDAMVVGG